jgi:hypothetical protein
MLRRVENRQMVVVGEGRLEFQRRQPAGEEITEHPAERGVHEADQQRFDDENGQDGPVTESERSQDCDIARLLMGDGGNDVVLIGAEACDDPAGSRLHHRTPSMRGKNRDFRRGAAGDPNHHNGRFSRQPPGYSPSAAIVATAITSFEADRRRATAACVAAAFGMSVGATLISMIVYGLLRR